MYYHSNLALLYQLIPLLYRRLALLYRPLSHLNLLPNIRVPRTYSRSRARQTLKKKKKESIDTPYSRVQHAPYLLPTPLATSVIITLRSTATKAHRERISVLVYSHEVSYLGLPSSYSI